MNYLNDISFEIILGAIVALIAMITLLKGFSLPKSYWDNQKKREELRRKRIVDEDDAISDMDTPSKSA
jgi:hypothetical protein